MARDCGLKGTLAVQAFNKADSIVATLESIARCDGSQKYDLVLLPDGCVGSKRIEIYSAARTDTNRAIEAWLDTNRTRFRSAFFKQLDRNHGPCEVARRVIDWAFETGDFVIFSEDDLIFEKDAIRWFEKVLTHPGFLRSEVWSAAAESKFFDAKRHVPSSADIARALEVARRQKLINRFVYFGFVPSSCFATTNVKWKEFGNTRGLAKGDRDVNLRCRDEAKVCLWPVVARCRDVGMHHPLGHSVRCRGTNHSVFKNNYVLSGMLESGSADLTELGDGEKATLFDESMQPRSA